jgi:N-acetylmuramoyl-L-alanine amidase
MMVWFLPMILLAADAAPPVLAIDPGHGGAHLGAIGPCGAREKEIALAVSRELSAILTASGSVRTILTRDGDQTLDLEDRYRIANEAGAVLFLSIHANASPNADARGVETYFLSSRASNRRIRKLADRENLGAKLTATEDHDALSVILDGLLLNAAHSGSQRFALRVQDSMSASVDTRGRGVLQAPFIVLLGAQMPAVLVEIGFVSNADECVQLTQQKYQRTIAQTLAAAMLEHLASDSAASARN